VSAGPEDYDATDPNDPDLDDRAVWVGGEKQGDIT
jgi:hypothetical protein